MADEKEQISFSAGLGDWSTLPGDNMADQLFGVDPDSIGIIPKQEEQKPEPPKEKTAPKLDFKKEEKEEQKPQDTFTIDDVLNEEDSEDETEDKVEEKEKEEDDSNPFSIIAQELFEAGIFTKDEDEEDLEIISPEELRDRFSYEKSKAAESILENLLDSRGPDARDLVQNVIINGVDPRDYIERYTKVLDLAAMDMTQEHNQEKVARDFFKKEGRSREYIDKQIDKLKNYGDLADESLEMHRIALEREAEDFKKSNQVKEEEENRKKRQKHEYQTAVGVIVSQKIKEKELDGIPLDDKFGKDLIPYLTQEKYQVKNTAQRLTEFDKDILDLELPENYEKKIKVAAMLKLWETDPKMSKIGKKQLSEKSSELFKGLTRKNKAPQRANGSSW